MRHSRRQRRLRCLWELQGASMPWAATHAARRFAAPHAAQHPPVPGSPCSRTLTCGRRSPVNRCGSRMGSSTASRSSCKGGRAR